MLDRPNDEETAPVSETNIDASSPTTSFSQRVYEVVTRIPHGRVTTYGAIAQALGVPRAATRSGLGPQCGPSGGGSTVPPGGGSRRAVERWLALGPP